MKFFITASFFFMTKSLLVLFINFSLSLSFQNWINIFNDKIHPYKSRIYFNDNYDYDYFANTPERAKLEIAQRILIAKSLQGFFKPYSQMPTKFSHNM